MNQSDKLETYLTEYEALRDETITKLRDRQHITYYSLTLLTGVLIFVSSEAFMSSGQFLPLKKLWRVWFFLFLPLIFMPMAFIRLRQDLLLAYTAQTTECKIAPKIYRLLDKPDEWIFEWERHLKSKRTPEGKGNKMDRLFQYFLSGLRYIPSLFLTIISLFLACLGMYWGNLSRKVIWQAWFWLVFVFDTALFFSFFYALIYKLLPETDQITCDYRED